MTLLRRHLPFRQGSHPKAQFVGKSNNFICLISNYFSGSPPHLRGFISFSQTKQYCVWAQEGQGHLAWDGCFSLKHFPVKHFNTEKFYMQHFVGDFLIVVLLRKVCCSSSASYGGRGSWHWRQHRELHSLHDQSLSQLCSWQHMGQKWAILFTLSPLQTIPPAASPLTFICTNWWRSYLSLGRCEWLYHHQYRPPRASLLCLCTSHQASAPLFPDGTKALGRLQEQLQRWC